MAITVARYIKNEKTFYVESEKFISNEDYMDIKDQLICPTLSCNCQLVFVNKTSNLHFRKHPNSNHEENCPYYTTISGSISRLLTSGSVSSTLSDDYINEKLKRASRKFLNSLNEVTTKPIKNTKPRNRKKTTTNDIEEIIPNVKITATGENLLEDKNKKLRKPSIREINRNNIIDAPNDRVISYIGILDISFDKKSNTYKLFSPLNNKNSKLHIILNEAYFSSTDIINFKEILTTLFKTIMNSNDTFYFISLGDLIKNDENYEFYISDYMWFYIFTELNGKVVRLKPDSMLNTLVRNNKSKNI